MQKRFIFLKYSIIFSPSEIQFISYEVKVSLQTCAFMQFRVDHSMNLDFVVKFLHLVGGESSPLKWIYSLSMSRLLDAFLSDDFLLIGVLY